MKKLPKPRFADHLIYKTQIQFKKFMKIDIIFPIMRFLLFLLPVFSVLVIGCARVETRTIEATAYCGCGKCCEWERGHWRYLKLNFWNRYITKGRQKGQPYSGLTASGVKPRQQEPGFFSVDSLKHPWKMPFRMVLFPWYFLPQKGTIAADTDYYPFGTKMYVPGYGWGVVEDRGGAIKGPGRIDVYYRSHTKALQFGRCHVQVDIYR